jgi:hypothetical protein
MTRTLDGADYWKLRAICSEAQRCELLALQARAELAAAQKKTTAALADLGLPAAPLGAVGQFSILGNALCRRIGL